MRFGVIGLGTVGYPLFKALEFYHKDVVGFDVKQVINSWGDTLSCDIVFLCLPTDLKKNGRLDMSVVEKVLYELEMDGFKGLVVVKSTLRMGIVRELIDRHSFSIVVFPEWLYAHNSFPGTLSPEMSVIGADTYLDAEAVMNICIWHRGKTWDFVTPEEAVLIKLKANEYAALKISFANETFLQCDNLDHCDAEVIMKVLRRDPRCSPRYLYPGWAFGGYCLPKDTSEVAYSCKHSFVARACLRINEEMLSRSLVRKLEQVNPKDMVEDLVDAE